jgi:hypothetical protein
MLNANLNATVLVIKEHHTLSKKSNDDAKLDAELEAALERILSAESIDDQVDREIRRYWNDRVKSGPNKSLMRRVRLAVMRSTGEDDLK